MDKDKKDTTTQEEKIKYEAEKEAERKRRFAILSGKLQPIKTDFQLAHGEHAYYQMSTDRMADREHVESYTSGQARSPLIKGGLLRGNTKIKTTSTQVRTPSNDIIDSGIMLFTDKRLLFIGKEVVAIPFDEILSIQFSYKPYRSSLIVKYNHMQKNESYDITGKFDAELFYRGLMRFLGKDKSKVTENDVDMSDFRSFIPTKDKKENNRKDILKKVGILIGIFLFVEIFLRNITPFIGGISFIMLVLSILFYPLVKYLNKHLPPVQNEPRFTKELLITKDVMGWSLGILIICLLVSSFASNQYKSLSSTTTTKAESQTKPTPQKTKAKESVLSKWQTVKKADDAILKYNNNLAQQCDQLVLGGYLGAMNMWSTTEPSDADAIYGQWSNSANIITTIPKNSQNYTLWNNLTNIDQQIVTDDQDTENECDYLSQDQQAISSGNDANYANKIQADKNDVDSLTVQRNTILKQLGY